MRASPSSVRKGHASTAKCHYPWAGMIFTLADDGVSPMLVATLVQREYGVSRARRWVSQPKVESDRSVAEAREEGQTGRSGVYAVEGPDQGMARIIAVLQGAFHVDRAARSSTGIN